MPSEFLPLTWSNTGSTGPTPEILVLRTALKLCKLWSHNRALWLCGLAGGDYFCFLYNNVSLPDALLFLKAGTFKSLLGCLPWMSKVISLLSPGVCICVALAYFTKSFTETGGHIAALSKAELQMFSFLRASLFLPLLFFFLSLSLSYSIPNMQHNLQSNVQSSFRGNITNSWEGKVEACQDTFPSPNSDDSLRRRNYI